MIAIINWLAETKGGRKKPPLGVGIPAYSTEIRFNDEPWPPVDASWSLVVEKIEWLSTEFSWIAHVHFLAAAAPHDSLRLGRAFELYEGNKRVASGVVCGNDGRQLINQ